MEKVVCKSIVMIGFWLFGWWFFYGGYYGWLSMLDDVSFCRERIDYVVWGEGIEGWEG